MVNMSMNIPTQELATAEKDIELIVGGNFTPDSIGPDKYAEVLARLRANPSRYLGDFEARFMGSNFDAELQSNMFSSAFLNLIADIAPEQVRWTAERLLKSFDDVMAIHDSAKNKEALLALLPDESISLVQRLEIRRKQLRAILLK
jgi:hypothetical protein